MNDEPPRLEKPTYLTNFLIAMAHSPELVTRLFSGEEDEALRREWNLTGDHLKLLREGNLQQIHRAVTSELPEGVYATAAFWIGIGKWPVPWPWIGS